MEPIFVGIILSLIQGITEFLPISSDGHLTLFSNLVGTPNLSFMVFLHLASLLAVIIFTRKEIIRLAKFDKKDRKYLLFLLIGMIPAGIFGLFFNKIVESTLSSLLFTGFAFIFTGAILLMTFGTNGKRQIDGKSSLLIGLAQILALFPGISRSGMTISMAKIIGIKNREAFRFSFLMLIPLTIGAFILEMNTLAIGTYLILPFIICLITSLLFLNILERIVIKNKFWIFSFYCFVIGIITIILHFKGF